MNSDDYLDEISQTAVITLADELEDRLKRDTIDEVKEALGQFFVKVEESFKEILRETVAKQDQILKLLNDRLLSSETERTELGQELERLKEKVETTIKEKVEAEKKIEAAIMEMTAAEKRTESALLSVAEEEKKLSEANKTNQLLNTQLITYMEKLTDAITLAEKLQSERDQLDKKLTQLQENWEKYLENG